MKLTALAAICAAALVFGCSKSSDSTVVDEAPPAPAAPAATAPSGGAMLPSGGDVQLAAFKDKDVEVGCGMCIYHMDGVKSCKTAAMIDGKPMLVKGQHSNAHSLGLCSTSKEVVMSGSVVGDEVVVTSLALK
jgi:hypothetical protein